ncbi:NADH-quinone oxidoreductase subunit H [Blastococcus sp. MG754426]|uniref:NADH-quinone oxidoreductase subunit H n=1 Tax=unclassified Blastococcus TaxID=2619396 RepID=UPI000DE83F0A|nr:MULTISPECIES: NADH-quinone oxidoreductase subunit H [unclassified Blastococcus]MCF6509969.1 NADH-quinone oxidoreductase subunit H [Blastococcus sp. MG754426]MCF6514361.1 NADH-quinone oxidoreductase subunit H [Blastococcus sp. MG754427]MCF6736118.1 NADH-quinone oxidoreductase subunit H [Blastococcus sp. KM273129]RBY95445.1 NADH-quinone oxidoreductase subunit H [Blastococcus sp. TF02-8]
MPEQTLAEAWGLVPAVLGIVAVGVVLGVVVAAVDRVVVFGASGAVVEPIRSSARLLAEQRRTTLAPDRLLWRIGCVAVPTLALLSLAVVPVAGRTLWSTSADLVWFNAMEALLWAAVWLVGWGPNAVHALTGGYRFLAQGLAYELPLMFALITAGLAAGSLRTTDVVAAQEALWLVVTMPVAFVVFVAGAAAFAFWGPFAAPAEADIAGGVTSELSGVDRLLVEAGRAVFLGASAAMAAALFLGGDSGPWLPGPLWHLLKTLAVVAALVWVGRRMPVLRPDRTVEVGWMVLVPLTLLQALVVAVLVLTGFYA